MRFLFILLVMYTLDLGSCARVRSKAMMKPALLALAVSAATVSGFGLAPTKLPVLRARSVAICHASSRCPFAPLFASMMAKREEESQKVTTTHC